MQDQTTIVYAGIDTHKSMHVLCIIDAIGKKLLTESFAANSQGYDAIADAIGDPGLCGAVGIEGTASYGAGLSSRLQELGYNVVEVLRPKRDKRRIGTDKNDAADAERAARDALCANGTSVPKSKDGWVEQLRCLEKARRQTVKTSTACINGVKSMLVSAPQRLRETYDGLPKVRLMRKAASGFECENALEEAVSESARALGRLWEEATKTDKELEKKITGILKENNPGLLALDGVGFSSAATLVSVAGDNPERMRSEASFACLCGVSPIEASSGAVVRHRLNRGGNRDANRALEIIATSRMKHDERTKDYISKKISEGKTRREAKRCLKRFIAREIYRHIVHPKTTVEQAGPRLRRKRMDLGLSQKDISEKYDIRRSTISFLETGRRVSRRVEKNYEDILDEIAEGREKEANASFLKC